MKGKHRKIRSDSKVGKHFEEICELYDSGWSMKRLGEHFGIDPSNVYRVLKQWKGNLRNHSEAMLTAIDKGIFIPKYGSDSYMWKGGKKKHTEGYLMILNRKHRKADCQGYVFEHILVAEKMLGRDLELFECVHHINKIRNDNRPENLQVMTTTEHRRLHGLEGAKARWSGREK